MELTIENCNCLDQAKINLEKGKVNLKYAMNGTGKSTISKAIELNAKGGEHIHALKPFKYMGMDNPDFLPKVTGADEIKSIKIFNEDYINQFVFKPDEVISNSFEIFIKNPEYDQGLEKIEIEIKEIKETFAKNENLELVIRDLIELSSAFGKSASGYSKAGALHKAIGDGNKLENIPEQLLPYKAFLQSSYNVKWLRWQMGGKDFLEISGECPYCVTPTENAKKEVILSVEKEYDSKAIEHLNNVINVLERLGEYFSDETTANLHKITTNKSTISEEEINYLKGIKSDIDLLANKLSSLKNLSFFSFKDVVKVIEGLENLKIRIEYLQHLKSHKTIQIVESINSVLDALIKRANDIQKVIGIHKSNISRTIKNHKVQIDSFLKYAGYKYVIEIEDINDSYKMRLRHIDYAGALQNGNQHLSYGEKNAFSLILFMYEAIKTNPDLIVLDDPISSFDRNKKFAILDTLFRRENSFKDKTVLLMTHDLEPVIDMVYNLAPNFKNPNAHFLMVNDGILVELPITKRDLVQFPLISNQILLSKCDDVIKLVYLRRSFEVVGNKGYGYQLISNLLHKREMPLWKDDAGEREMSPEEIHQATTEVQSQMNDFDYKKIIARILDDAEMLRIYKSASNNYEKLQIYRIICADKKLHENDIVAKFINEAFHIENDYLMQLNPAKYETTPQFIIDECDHKLGV